MVDRAVAIKRWIIIFLFWNQYYYYIELKVLVFFGIFEIRGARTREIYNTAILRLLINQSSGPMPIDEI